MLDQRLRSGSSSPCVEAKFRKAVHCHVAEQDLRGGDLSELDWSRPLVKTYREGTVTALG